MFEHVVVGVRDVAGGRDAVALAKELVSASGALTLVHVHLVTRKPAPDSGAVGDAAKRQLAMERLNALAGEAATDAQVAVVEARSARQGLHEFASTRHADLLVVRASERDDLARDFIGDDTKEVLEEAPCAVAIAPSGYSSHAAALRRIGVAYDGSPESELALALARRLAAERDASLSAFEALTMPSPARDPWDVDRELHGGVHDDRSRVAALTDLEAEAIVGDPADELARYGRSVDLLVIGSHKYRPIDRLLALSTAQRLADEPASPLLVLTRAT